MKDVLKKCLDKRNRMTRSGAAGSTLPKCQYFDQMAFLHEKSANKPTESNLTLATSPDIMSPSEEECSLSNQRSPSESPSVGIGVDTPVNLNKNTQRKKRRLDSTEVLSKSLADCDKLLQKSLNEENDEDSLYCRSLVPIMRELPTKQKRLAEIKISQLFDLQYEDNC